jgi:ubiquinone/menaquinone biosynthesis C-methylase UbiE
MISNPYNKLANIYGDWIVGDETNLDVLDFYIKIVSKYNPSFVIELGVGTCRVAIEIIKRLNKRVIGVDSSKCMLNICKKNIFNNNISEDNIILFEQDILTFNQKSKFIIMPFRTIGHFLSLKDKQELLKHIFNILENDGIFIFDHYILDKKWATENNKKYIKMYRDNNYIIHDKYNFNFDKKILNCKVFKNRKEISSFEFSWFEPNEIKKIVDEIGFKVINVYGDFEFNPLQDNSSQQIWILQK